MVRRTNPEPFPPLTTTAVLTTVISLLDYCNHLLTSIPPGLSCKIVAFQINISESMTGLARISPVTPTMAFKDAPTLPPAPQCHSALIPFYSPLTGSAPTTRAPSAPGTTCVGSLHVLPLPDGSSPTWIHTAPSRASFWVSFKCPLLRGAFSNYPT